MYSAGFSDFCFLFSQSASLSAGEENQLPYKLTGPQLFWKHRDNEKSMRGKCSLPHGFVRFLERVFKVLQHCMRSSFHIL